MSTIDPDGKNVVFVFGAPRSGTTWLGKIFDSHPGVIYRHEPDTVVRSSTIPVLCSDADSQRYLADARRYLFSLLNSRTLKSAGSLPQFYKSYRRWSTEQMRRGMVYLGKASVPKFAGAWVARLSIPDLIDLGQSPTYVMKSVSSRGRVKVFANALSHASFVYVIRHPCGQVASMLDGIRSGKFERAVPFGEILETIEARQANLTRAIFEQLDIVERCAWHWAILNQKAINDLPGHNRAMVLKYEDLCTAPEEVTKDVFRFTQLHWNSQSERFVRKSTRGGDADSYYGVNRNAQVAAEKWRSVLDVRMRDRILAIAARVAVGDLFKN